MEHLWTDKNLMGGLAVAMMLLACGVQLSKTYAGKAEPHPIAWFGFGLLTGVGFLIQWQKSAGPGSWVMGSTAIGCILVGSMSQYMKRWRLSDFDRWDWGALAAGAGFFAFYLRSRNLSFGPLVSAVLATSADLVLYIPIFKNAWLLPRKETATAYGLNSLKFLPSLFAMDSYSVETCLYPSAMIVINATVVLYLAVRRQRLAQ